MKRILITIVLNVLAIQAFSQSFNTVTTYYDWGKTKIHEVYQVISGTPTKHGLYKKYDEDGFLIEETMMANGQLNGVSKTFYAGGEENGKVGSIETYKNGIKDGLFENYEYKDGIKRTPKTQIYKDGEVVKETFRNEKDEIIKVGDVNGINYALYKNGQKEYQFVLSNGVANSESIGYYPNGKVKKKGSFLNNKEVGKWLEYSDSGVVIKETEYNDGVAVIEKYFLSDGSGGVIKDVKNNDGLYTETTYQNGKIYSVAEKIYGQEKGSYEKKMIFNGKYTEFYPDGKIKQDGVYELNFKNGIWKKYIQSGSTLESLEYNDGKLDGKCTYYFPNGNKHIEGDYKKGESYGALKTYYQSGKDSSIWNSSNAQFVSFSMNGDTLEKGKIYDGKKSGHWVIYKNGQAASFKTYNDGLLISSVTNEDIEGEKMKDRIPDLIVKIFGVNLSTDNHIDGMVDSIEHLYKTRSILSDEIIVYKKKHLYNAYCVLKSSLKQSIESKSSSIKEKHESCNRLINLCNKMKEMLNSNTSEIEKQLKNEDNPEKIASLFGV